VLFRILGPLEAWTGQEWATISAPKWRALLAVLLLAGGQPVATDQLIAELWGDDPPARAANLVSVYVHRLRRLVGDTKSSVLVTRAPGYQAVLGPGALDAELFANLLAKGRQALSAGEADRAMGVLTEALELWRGSALADVPDTPVVAAETRRLEEARVEATQLRAEAQLACGRPAEVVPDLRRLLAAQPLREELWALLMRALYGAGRQAAALEAYEQARRQIADELGVDPSAQLQEIYHKILNGEPIDTGAARRLAGLTPPPTPAPAPAQLPADIADFTGRAGQVEELCTLLPGGEQEGTPGVVRVVLVVGSGGLGKTALAVHAAHRVAGQFPDGQLYASLLGATNPADPADILARFLRDLGMDPARIPLGEEERAAQLRTMLAGKRVLIVLDDARDAAQVRPLLPGSASCAMLVTARGRLPAIAGSRVMDLDVLPPAESRALFGLVAGQERADAEPEATEQVLRACAGLPLAIRIAGARLAARGGWSVLYLADRLSDERRRLDELRVGNLAVRASFEVSFASLPAPGGDGGVDPARAFRLLGLWTGPLITLPAASALLGEPEDAVADALDVLVDAHLLESPEPDEYRFHDLLRVYAADRARTQEPEQDRHAAITRVLTWYLHTAEATARVISPHHTRVPLDPPPPDVHPLGFTSLSEALQWCEAKRAGLLAATRLAAGRGLHEIAWKLPAAAMSFYYRRSHWADWVSTHEIGLASARVLGDGRAEAWMLNNLGMAYGVQRMDEAVTCFEEALALCRRIGDRQGEARAANNVANALVDLGRFAEAVEAAERSLAIQRNTGNEYGEGLALGALGHACCELGRFEEAVEYVLLALAIFRGLGDPMVEAHSLSDLGQAYLGLGRVEEAIGSLSESLAIWRDIGDSYGQAATLRRLGQARRRAGDIGQARELLAEALHLFGVLGDQAQAAKTQTELMEITKEAG